MSLGSSTRTFGPRRGASSGRSAVSCFVALLVAGLASGASAARLGENPVQKVLSLLGQLEAKIKKDGEAEQKAYEAFVDWCKGGAGNKEYEIKTAKTAIESLEATIDKAVSDISAMSSKVEDIASSISASDADLKAATEIREKEHEEFVTMEKELDDTINTIERAINVLERKMHGSAMLQAPVNTKEVGQVVHALDAIVGAAALSLSDKQKLVGLIQSSEDSDDDSFGAPAPEAYKTHSENIIDVLEDLKQKAVVQLEQARREEVNARHNFEMMKQSLSDQLEVDQKDIAASKMMKHEAAETKAASEGELAITKKGLADAEAVLKTLMTDCLAKATNHETSVKNRAKELKALADAKAAISDSMAGSSSLVYGTASFLQVVDTEAESKDFTLQARADLSNFEVVNLVRKLAREQKSAALTQLAGRISAIVRRGAGAGGSDPFAKVRGLISDMIERLTREQGEEASHKAYCDKEMAGTKQKLDELKYDIEKHSSKIDKASATSVAFKDAAATLASEIAEITKSQAEADALRKEEHSVYVQSESDLKQGLDGIRMALKVLREYYASEPAAASLAQQPQTPEAHTKATGAATSIIGMLEVVESDLERNLAAARISEEDAAVAYERVSMENKVSKAMKEKDVKYKQKEAAGLDKSVAERVSDRDSLQTELDAVLQYSTNIRGMCELKPLTYEDRKTRREAEVAGLQNALQILNGQAMLLQRAGRHAGLRGAAINLSP